MSSCDGYQAQMLEYLYDLLEGDERQALERHVDGCAACQAALARVRGQQRLLAAAGRMEFPSVTFTPPPEQPAPASQPASGPLPARKIGIWLRWAAAAAVLLVVGGLGGAGVWVGRDYTEAQRRVEHQQAVVAQADRDYAEA